MSLLLAVLILGLIILFHEFGHFLLAKLCGIGVLEFSLGMGPRLVSVQRGETRYSIKALPFGGSCMMLGEDEEDKDPRAFNNKPVLSRILVVAAGPVFNFLLAFVLALILVGATGRATARVMDVQEGYPAQAAGIQPGDVITRVNGRSVHSYQDISFYLLTHPDRELSVVWKRQGEDGRTQTMKADLVSVYSQESGQYLAGVVFDARLYPAEGILDLAASSVYEVQFWIRYVLDSFYMMFHGMVSVDDVSGPVGIVTTIDSTVEEASPYGIGAVLLMLINFSILLNANLGAVNLLPLPALDGGRLVFLFIELIRGKPIDKEKEGMVHMAGMLFLLALMVLILFNDLRKLF